MEDFLNGGVEELEAAKRAIIEEAELNLAADDAKAAVKTKEKELNARKMFMADKIDSTTKNRRIELEKDHDGKLEEAKRDVKEARRKKKEALSLAVRERVKNETADIHEENNQIKGENKQIFKNAKIPGFCNTPFYYALFVPRSGLDFIIFVFSIIITVALIPNVVCVFLSWKLFFKVILYVAIVVFFALIYFLVSLWTKSGNKLSVLESARPNMDKIKQNKKTIKKLKRGIKKDSNEEQYGLEAYDREIERCVIVFDEKSAEKQKALEYFEQVTALQIRKEVEDEILPQIDSLTVQLQELSDISAQKSAIASQASKRLASEYTLYLGEKYTTCERIDELIAVINEGKAANISAALDIVKGAGK